MKCKYVHAEMLPSIRNDHIDHLDYVPGGTASSTEAKGSSTVECQKHHLFVYIKHTVI